MLASTSFSPVILVALALGPAAPCLAGDASLLAASEYRLNVEKPGAFRLAGSAGPASPLPAAPPIATQLADKPFAQFIDSAAREAALEPALVHAVIYVESRYNPTARSPKGALGLMQVLPGTAARYGITNPTHSIEANLRAGTRYLSDLMELFDNRLELVLAAYNAGEQTVLRYGRRIPPYRETQHYVPAVLAKYREWQEPPLPVVTVRRRIEYLPGTLLDPAMRQGLHPDT